MFTLKLVRIVPKERNRADVIEKRRDYATWFMNYAILRNCVFINECSYNVRTTRSEGMSRVGERAYAGRFADRGGET